MDVCPQGVSVTLPVSAAPPLSVTVSLTTVGYSDDPANMQLPLNQVIIVNTL